MHKYTLGTYSKGKNHNKKKAEIAMLKNSIRQKDRELKRLEHKIIKKINEIEAAYENAKKELVITN